jgi:hypothetical protein
VSAPRRLAVVVVTVVATLATLGGCGIPEDGQPRDIADAALPPELADPGVSSTAVGGGEGSLQEVDLYLVRTDGSSGEALVPVPRTIRLPSSRDAAARALTEALITSSPELLSEPDLVNAVPSDVQVHSAVVRDDGVLELDLTNLGNSQSQLQRLAVAQLIFTLTGPERLGIDAIRFSVDGAEVAVPIEGKVAPPGTAVGRADEPSFLPAESPTTTRPDDG